MKFSAQTITVLPVEYHASTAALTTGEMQASTKMDFQLYLYQHASCFTSSTSWKHSTKEGRHKDPSTDQHHPASGFGWLVSFSFLYTKNTFVLE